MVSHELKSGKPRTCPKCLVSTVEAVHRNGYGWYIGTWCDCGPEPYTVESEYYKTRELADEALKEGTYGRAA